jgi:hypothetical protein
LAHDIQPDSAEKQRIFRDFWGCPKWRRHAEMWPANGAVLAANWIEVRPASLIWGAMSRTRRPPRRYRKPHLTITQILAWADDYHRQHGEWPRPDSGSIPGQTGETWSKVQLALHRGLRGLSGKTTLLRLLHAHRGVRPRRSALDADSIVNWARHEHARTGRWPRGTDGAIVGVTGETWSAIDSALKSGRRGLSGGSSLAKLLKKQGTYELRSFTVQALLAWADAFFASHGAWPTYLSGAVESVPGVSWASIDRALRLGIRGFKGKSSLSRLLKRYRGNVVPRMQSTNRTGDDRSLTMVQVWEWARSHHRRTGKWPLRRSGLIPESNGLTWHSIDACLRSGRRGLPGGSSLAKLFRDRRGKSERTA